MKKKMYMTRKLKIKLEISIINRTSKSTNSKHYIMFYVLMPNAVYRPS